MSNPYYTYTALVSHALGRSGQVNSELSAIEDGFDAVFAAQSSLYAATSTTSRTIAGSGSLSWVIASGSFIVGQFLLFADTTTPGNWMMGQVTAFDSGTLTVTATILDSGGSGTIANWTISLVPPGYESTYFQDILDDKANVDDADFTGTATFEACAGGAGTTPAAFAFDCDANNFFKKTCTGSHTISFTNVPSGGSWAGIIELTNGGLGVLTLPSGSTWEGGAAPTLSSSGLDILTVFTMDGGTSWRWALRDLASA